MEYSVLFIPLYVVYVSVLNQFNQLVMLYMKVLKFQKIKQCIITRVLYFTVYSHLLFYYQQCTLIYLGAARYSNFSNHCLG